MKSCKNVVTIKQFTGTCWFNALLMIFFYSDRTRKLMIRKSKTWKTSDPRLAELYSICKKILKDNYSYTKKTKARKFGIFNDITPEHILETLNKLDANKFHFNPRSDEGYAAQSYVSAFCALFHITFDDLVILPRKDKNVALMYDGRHLDAQICTNFNIDMCKSGHQISGITCRGQRYMYNGWLRFPEDQNIPVREAYPCELIPYDWVNNDTDFCIDTRNCQLPNMPNIDLKKEQCFNFSKGDNYLIYVRDEDGPMNMPAYPQLNLVDPHIYNSDCVRVVSNNVKKMQAVIANIRKDLNHKHVIYTDFKKSAKAFKELLEKEFPQYKVGYLVSGIVDNGKPLTVAEKTGILKKFNARPVNIHGDKMKFMIIDGAFKEGIDLFDVKHVHIMEPPMSNSNLKQVIGRATRTCGQMGLEFTENVGWPLNVHIYDVKIPDVIRHRKGLAKNINTMHKLALVASVNNEEEKRIDTLYDMISKNSMDYKYNVGVNFPDRKMTRSILKSDYTWHLEQPPKDKCNNRPEGMSLTPSQKFVRDHFKIPKGLLAIHSVGTGKTITAIATALETFKDYTVLWVTRSSLKADMKKDLVKFGIDTGKIGAIPPLSYKQFANMLSGGNDYYKKLVKLNGSDDVLRKVFIIIDEAHKLIDQSDLKAQERVDINVLHKMIQNSFKVSGEDSCKVLLMTATPIVKSSTDFFTLMRLVKSEECQMSYEQGRELIDKKSKDLKAWIKGNVSYLDRSKDASQFAQPVIEFHYVDMSERIGRFSSKNDVKQMRENMKNPKKKYLREIYKEENALFKKDKSQEVMIEEKCLE